MYVSSKLQERQQRAFEERTYAKGFLAREDKILSYLTFHFGWSEERQEFIFVRVGSPPLFINPGEIVRIQVAEVDGFNSKPLRRINSKFFHQHENPNEMEEGDVDWENVEIKLFGQAIDHELCGVHFCTEETLMEWLELIMQEAPQAVLE